MSDGRCVIFYIWGLILGYITMDAVRQLNEKLQKSWKPPAETCIDGLLYFSNICPTKELAAESYFANTTPIENNHVGISLVDCRSSGRSRWKNLFTWNHMVFFVTDDKNEMKMLEDNREQVIFGPNCDSLMIMRLGQFSCDEDGPLHITVYTDSPTVREFVADVAEERISWDLMLDLSIGMW
jgi:hypothetical protein